MQANSQRLTILLILVMLLVSACTLPGGVTSTQMPVDAIYTAAAQTLQAQLTQSAAQQPPTQTPQPGLPPTDTPPPPAEALPTDTATLAFTDTPAFTPTSTVPVVVVDTNSNCRNGPSTAYDPPIAVLRKGDRAEIFGRNNDRSWWYVQIPGRQGQYCWVWGQNVTVEGDTGGVQVVQPPAPPKPTATPTPEASFDPSFDNVHTCGGDPYAIFELDNTGGVDFESMRLVIVDRDDNDDEIYDDDSDAPFMGDGSECPPGGDVFPDGKTFWVGGNIQDGTSGHEARATITLCTEDDLDGVCVSERVTFDIP